MEDTYCEKHEMEMNVYCLDCKALRCPQCPPSAPCKRDHKKVALDLAAKEVQVQREIAVNEMVHLFAEVINMENKLEKNIQKIENLNTPCFSRFFDAMRVIQDRIESIQESKEKLPLELAQCKGVFAKIKGILVENLSQAKQQLERTAKDFSEGRFVQVISGKEVNIPDISNIYKSYVELNLDVKTFFTSIFQFNEIFILKPVEDSPAKKEEDKTDNVEMKAFMKGVMEQLL